MCHSLPLEKKKKRSNFRRSGRELVKNLEQPSSTHFIFTLWVMPQLNATASQAKLVLRGSKANQHPQEQRNWVPSGVPVIWKLSWPGIQDGMPRRLKINSGYPRVCALCPCGFSISLGHPHMAVRYGTSGKSKCFKHPSAKLWKQGSLWMEGCKSHREELTQCGTGSHPSLELAGETAFLRLTPPCGSS